MNAKEIDQLEDMLASDIFKHEAMTLDALQGLICAVVSGPEPIPPSVWIPAALGDSPQYTSNKQAQEFMDLLMKFYNSIANTLSKGEELELILYGMEDDPDELDYAAWCEAYVYGSQLGGVNWLEAAGDFSLDLTELMETFFLLSGMLKEDAIKNKEPWLSKKEEAQAIAMAQDNFAETIGTIYGFWKARRETPQTITREAEKVGRNDPCPCGSGKKYKNCCGKEPTIH
jgi:uncharacterized protein